jgi:phosphoribosylamine--glycine ligase
VIGGGGREHALAWKVAQSPRVAKVFVAPGNAGTAADPELTNVPIGEIATLVAFAQREAVVLTIVGPEGPLAAGIVDAFTAAGLRIFGPTRAAARLESSKDFAKAFMQRHRIPTAAYATFTARAAAHAYVTSRGAPIVVKADGLAAGKGVVVAMDERAAHAAVDAMLPDAGPTGARVVIEEFLDGEEASFIVMADGAHALALASSQDHKRLADGDTGPNTGGMGAYSPAPVVTPTVHARIMRKVVRQRSPHGRRRHALHRLPLCGRDDRRERRAARARIQLQAHRRSRNTADPGAAALGPHAVLRSRSPDRSTASKPNGIAAPR